MRAHVSIPQLLSDLGADAATIGFDVTGGLYDRVYEFIEKRNVLPESTSGRVALVASTLLALRLVQQQLDGTSGPIANFTRELASDTIREESKRILERLQKKIKNDPDATNTFGARNTLWNADESTRTKLLASYRAMTPDEQRAMREQMLCSTTEQLLWFSSLCPEDSRTMLAIIRPHTPQPQKGFLDSAAETLFPWTREKKK